MVLKFNYNCQICHVQFKNCSGLTAHLKFKHKNEMSYETYYLKYMNTKSIPGECVICGMPTTFLNLNKGYKLTCSRKCGVQLNIKNQKLDNYAKAKLTRSNTLKKKYNIESDEIITSPFVIKTIRDLSKNTWHKLYGENIDNPFQVETIKKSIQKTMIKKYGGKTTMESKVLKEKVQNTNKIVYGGISTMCSDEVRKKALNTIKNNFTIQDDITSPFCIKEICDKKEETLLDRYGKLNFNKKYKYNNLFFDSSWELAYYIWLKDNNVIFEYHPKPINTFKYYWKGDDKIHTYYPDFKLENDDYIEIKNNFLLENMIFDTQSLEHAKYECMLKNNIKIISNNEIQFYLNYIENKYNIHYLNQFSYNRE